MKKFPLIILLTFPFIGVFFFTRLFLFLSLYPEKAASFPEWIGIFFNGLFYDFSSTCLLSIFSVLLMSGFKKFPRLRIFGGWLLYILWVTLLLLLIVDGVFFHFFYHHLTRELFQIHQDWTYLFNIALKEYPFHLILLAIASLLAFLYWFYCLHILTPIKVKRPLIAVLIWSWGISGSLNPLHPLSFTEAFKETDSLSGNLTLNPAFSLLQNQSSFPFMNQLLSLPKKTNSSLKKDQYPFLRHYSPRSESPNIIFILLESWGYSFIDSLSGNSYGVTPFFDKIIPESTTYSQCYSNGNQSLYAWQILLTGIPFLPGMPSLGCGLEEFHFTRMGSYAKKSGYYPVFFQAYPRHWDKMDIVSKLMGFKEFYGAQDYPLILNYPPSNENKYGWDYEMYQSALMRLKTISSPFFAFIVTGATHYPYLSPGASFEKYPPFSKMNKFLNLLNYSDWCLGQFMSQAKQEPWFKNTLFIFTADHNTFLLFGNGDDKEMAHIPLVFYYPGKIPADSKNTLCSQADIQATCLDYFGKGLPFGSIGQSLLHSDSSSFIIRPGNTIITKDSKNQALVLYPQTKYTYKLNISEKKYFSLLDETSGFVQMIQESVKTNRWIPIVSNHKTEPDNNKTDY